MTISLSFLIATIISLLPFGTLFAIKDASSLYSLSFFLVQFLFVFKFTKSYFASFCLCLLLALIAFLLFDNLYPTYPLIRVIATAFYFSPFLLLFSTHVRPNLYISASHLNSTLIFLRYATLAMCSYATFQYLVFTERPSAFFDEPTRLGLYLSAYLGALLYTNTFSKFPLFGSKLFSLIEISLTVIALLLTRTTHYTSLFVSILLISCFKLFSSITSLRIKSRYFALFSMLCFLCIFSLFLLFSTGFLDLSRFDIFSSLTTSTNLSLLVWLRSLDLASYAIYDSPIIGFGVGTFGHTNHVSSVSNILSNLQLVHLNIYDGYSLFYRMLFEFGPLITLLASILPIRLLVSQIHNLEYYIQSSLEIRNLMFFKIFCLILFIGALIKEPILTSFPFTYIPLLVLLSLSKPYSPGPTSYE